MTDTMHRESPTQPSTLPGAAVIRRIRSLLFWAVGTSIVYIGLTYASRGRCAGGMGASGYVDANGAPTDAVPACVTLSLRPSVLVFVVIGVMIVVAITRVLRRADSEAAAIRILDHAVIGVVAVTVVWAAITVVSFMTIPLDAWDGTEPFFPPFTFGDVTVHNMPMTGTGG